MLSPALFAVYVDDLLQEIRSLDIGCHVEGVFMGAVGFCDDILLIAPSRCSMAVMLSKCEEFAIENNLVFSTDPVPSKSKTKCLFITGKNKIEKPAPLILNGKELPWVDTASHLGHELHVDGTMEHDARCKKYSFIEKTTQIRETFNFAHPGEIIQAMRVYSCDYYGAMLWDLSGNMANQVFRVWNTAIKLAWGLPRKFHNYFLSMLADGTVSARKDVLCRYASFVKKLKVSACTEVAIFCNIVSRDVRSLTGRNVKLLEQECGV